MLAVEAVPTEATFNDYVKRVEAGLEKTAKADLPTSYRQAGSGLIARIGTTPTEGDPGHRAHHAVPVPDLPRWRTHADTHGDRRAGG